MKTQYPPTPKPSTPHVADHPGVPLPKLRQDGTRAIEVTRAQALAWFEEQRATLRPLRGTVQEPPLKQWSCRGQQGHGVTGYGPTPLAAIQAAMPTEEIPTTSTWLERSARLVLRWIATYEATVMWSEFGAEPSWSVRWGQQDPVRGKLLALLMAELARELPPQPPEKLLSDLSTGEVTLVNLPSIPVIAHDCHAHCYCRIALLDTTPEEDPGRELRLLLEDRLALVCDAIGELLSPPWEVQASKVRDAVRLEKLAGLQAERDHLREAVELARRAGL